MGAEDITEVFSPIYIVTARRRIGWVGDTFSVGPAWFISLRNNRRVAFGWLLLPFSGFRFWRAGSTHFFSSEAASLTAWFYKFSRWALFCRFRFRCHVRREKPTFALLDFYLFSNLFYLFHVVPHGY